MNFEFTFKCCVRVGSINIFVGEAQIVAHKSSFDVVSSVINYMETLFEVFIFEHYDYEKKSRARTAHLFYDFTTESCKVPMFCKILRNLQTFLMLLIIFFLEICQILVAFNGMHEVYLKLVS